MENDILIALTFLLIAALFSVILWRGLVKFFNRHNTFKVIMYIVFFFPIAFFHILFIGFGFKRATPSPKIIPRETKKLFGWKFKCIGCGKDVHLKCHNCGHTEFKRINRGFTFVCLKCKDEKFNPSHKCNPDANRRGSVTTYIDKHPNRFSKSDANSWFKEYDC